MKILLLSDLHAGSIEYNDRARSFLNALNSDDEANKAELVICLGDLTYQGLNYYYLLEYFFRNTFFTGKTLLFIPGNHDCMKEAKFEEFNHFVQKFNPQHPNFLDTNCGIYEYNSTSFLLINTSYHYNHKKGEVHIPTLLAQLEKVRAKTLIAVTHHHFVKTNEDKDSYISNFGKLVSLLADKNCKAFVHGHLHERVNYSEYEATNLILGGVSSFSWSKENEYSVDFINITGDTVTINSKEIKNEK